MKLDLAGGTVVIAGAFVVVAIVVALALAPLLEDVQAAFRLVTP